MLGINDVDLDWDNKLLQALDIVKYEIDAIDSEGRTPLSWAVECGKSNHVRTLVEFGANPSIGSASDRTPLHYAASASSPDMLAILLENGASADAKDIWGRSPLHIAALSQDDPSFISPLLEYGTNINGRDSCDSTALTNALFMNNEATARFLLSHEASMSNLDEPDLSGLNASFSQEKS